MDKSLATSCVRCTMLSGTNVLTFKENLRSLDLQVINKDVFAVHCITDRSIKTTLSNRKL